MDFKLKSNFSQKGDQVKAIEEITRGLNNGLKEQTQDFYHG